MATTSDIREFLITIGELKSFERPGIINLRKRYQDRLCKGAACHSFDSQFCGLNTFCVTNDSKPSVLLVIFHGEYFLHDSQEQLLEIESAPRVRCPRAAPLPPAATINVSIDSRRHSQRLSLRLPLRGRGCVRLV
eukprot:GHVU01086595.1.p1 GENE.GHVU01086595.1~~GHVU01086595.1.p1  ORF type:complete len:135 (+),score=6.79 GHVU01086595.1:158-562(+)